MEPNDIDLIYRNGRHYDRLFGTPYMPFWIERARKAGDPVLELGCGTGKISIPLAEAGFKVVGLDLSQPMLEVAQRKTEDCKLSIEWVHGDMRDFDLGRRFRLIILPSNNLCHLLDIAAVESCFRGVRNHLAAGGHFVITVFVPNLKLLLQDPSEEKVMSEYDDPDGKGKVVVTCKSLYESDTQIKRNTTYLKKPGEPEIIGHLDMRMFFPQELDALLKYNGFRIIAKFGDHQKAPFDRHSKDQLIVATKNG